MFDFFKSVFNAIHYLQPDDYNPSELMHEGKIAAPAHFQHSANCTDQSRLYGFLNLNINGQAYMIHTSFYDFPDADQIIRIDIPKQFLNDWEKYHIPLQLGIKEAPYSRKNPTADEFVNLHLSNGKVARLIRYYG